MTEPSAKATEQAPRGGSPSRARRPGPAAVIWGSIALFAAMFALLTYELSASSAKSGPEVLVRKVVKRRVVTTVVPTPGESTITTGPVSTSQSSYGAAPVTTGAS